MTSVIFASILLCVFIAALGIAVPFAMLMQIIDQRINNELITVPVELFATIGLAVTVIHACKIIDKYIP